jgi:hypothetical protein
MSSIHTRLVLKGRLLHEIASSQHSLVYRDKGIIVSHGSLKYGSGEFTKPGGFGVMTFVLPTTTPKERY